MSIKIQKEKKIYTNDRSSKRFSQKRKDSFSQIVPKKCVCNRSSVGELRGVVQSSIVN